MTMARSNSFHTPETVLKDSLRQDLVGDLLDLKDEYEEMGSTCRSSQKKSSEVAPLSKLMLADYAFLLQVQIIR